MHTSLLLLHVEGVVSFWLWFFNFQFVKLFSSFELYFQRDVHFCYLNCTFSQLNFVVVWKYFLPPHILHILWLQSVLNCFPPWSVHGNRVLQLPILYFSYVVWMKINISKLPIHNFLNNVRLLKLLANLNWIQVRYHQNVALNIEHIIMGYNMIYTL